MSEIEKTCENCEYENEDMEGTHCRHCIHNAKECFEPKVIVLTEKEIRAKAIGEFAEKLTRTFKCEELQTDFIAVSDVINIIYQRAEQLKGGAV